MSIFDFLNSNMLAMNIVLVLAVIVALIYLIAFLQGRDISFWPPKIGRKPQPNNTRNNTNTLETESKTASLFKSYGVNNTQYFVEFSQDFDSLIENSESITLCFVHSRRWRENHLEQLENFLEKRKNQLTVILPNLANEELIRVLKEHFDDGENLEAFIKDAYRYFGNFLRRRPEGIDVRLFDLYPTYSFYKFDSSVILAMYPMTPRRKHVPAFSIIKDSKYWDFITDDIQWILSHTTSVQLATLKNLMDK